MAEIAIPMAVLGVMYIISNKDESIKNDSIKEGYRNNNLLPNAKKIIKNYPTEKKNDLLNETNVQTYSGYRNRNENLYQPTGYKRALESKDESFQSLTGNNVKTTELEHNNMVPFFGSKITQGTGEKGYEGVLDLYTGAGSQQNRKEGIAPLFKPEANMSHIHGTPVSTDFYHERQKAVVTTKMNNVKPWQEIQVGPGLGKGYSSNGSGGFNSGMALRTKDTLPRTVDQLRVSTNPKVTYGGQVLGAYGGNNPASKETQGQVSKNRPDTYYENSASRWFTTTGIEKAQKARSAVILQNENRTTTTREYFGNAGENGNEGTYQPGKYRKTHKQHLGSENMGAADKQGSWKVTNKDYGKTGYISRPNARTFTSERTKLIGAGTVVSALTAPLLDLLRPTRKQNVIGNMRPTGNVQGINGNHAEPIWNPNDTPVHTIREQTENTPHMLMGGANKKDGYLISKNRTVAQNRDTTNTQYMGGSGAQVGTTKPRTYDSDYNARLNPNKEIVSKVDRYNIGNHSLGSHYQNVTTYSNTATNPVQNYPNMPKASANMQTHGELSGKNTRERAVNCGRNNPDMIKAFNQNPYSQSLQSWA
tara:strand:+ start:4513 stop:6285 length:1773 start_codon:yes stop_codon:yes gene_type:complete